MPDLFDPAAPKRPTNVSLNSDLLAKARAAGLNLSATLEQALIDQLRKRQRGKWLAENRGAIEAYNEKVEEGGVFSDGLRSF